MGKLLAPAFVTCLVLGAILSRGYFTTALAGGCHHYFLVAVLEPLSAWYHAGGLCLSACTNTFGPLDSIGLLLLSGDNESAVAIRLPSWKSEILGYNFSFAIIKWGDLGRPHSSVNLIFLIHNHHNIKRLYFISGSQILIFCWLPRNVLDNG